MELLTEKFTYLEDKVRNSQLHIKGITKRPEFANVTKGLFQIYEQ